MDVSTTRPHAGDTVTVTPKPDDGYDVQTVTVTDEDGETVPVTPNADGSFTFTQPEGEVTIDVAFTPHVSSSIQLQDGSAVDDCVAGRRDRDPAVEHVHGPFHE